MNTQTIRIPNRVRLSPAAQGLYDTAAFILLASQGQAGALRDKLQAGCVGQFGPAWRELRPYLRHIVIPTGGENRFAHYYELHHEPVTGSPEVHMSAAEGRAYLADQNRIRGYREPEINGTEKYTHIPVPVLRDRMATLAVRGLMDYAWRVAALAKHELTQLHKEQIVAMTRCKITHMTAAWRQAKQLGYIYQQRIIDDTTGRIDWAYRLLPAADAAYCASAQSAVQRRSAASTHDRIVDHRKPQSHVASTHEERAAVVSLLKDNLHYEELIANAKNATVQEQLADYLSLLTATICTKQAAVCISGTNVPADEVRQQLLRLTGSDLLHVMQRVNRQSALRTPRAYRLAALYQAAADTSAATPREAAETDMDDYEAAMRQYRPVYRPMHPAV